MRATRHYEIDTPPAGGRQVFDTAIVGPQEVDVNANLRGVSPSGDVANARAFHGRAYGRFELVRGILDSIRVGVLDGARTQIGPRVESISLLKQTPAVLHLLDQTPERFKTWLDRQKLPGYRAAQVRRWLFDRCVGGFDAMSDLPKSLRRQLADEYCIWTTGVVARREADDGTEKLLLELADGERIECVLLSDDRHHRTVCISTQVGCAMGCVFCASGLDGVVRNLSAGEIVEQILRLKQLLGSAERISHIVVMGMGEPLANLDRLLSALATAAGPDALDVSARRITISTVGLPKGIRRLADEDCQYHLAVSLHAPDDALRDRLVPANRKAEIASILSASDYYFDVTGRRVTFEYVLLADVNDQPDHARRLAGLLKGRPALVNVIPYNPVSGLPYRAPSGAACARFVDILERGGLNVKIRYRKGERIDAACGQLRRSRA